MRFQRLVQNAFAEIDRLYNLPYQNEGIWKRCAAIAWEIGDAAAVNGLPDLYQASRTTSDPMTVKTFLSRCLATCSNPVPRTVLTVQEAATALGISERTLRGLIATGDLGHHRVGNGRGQIRISPSDLEDYQGRTKTTFNHLFR
jgi:excisionase family DNA binding protein